MAVHAEVGYIETIAVTDSGNVKGLLTVVDSLYAAVREVIDQLHKAGS
jgi:hypothetical protein